MLFSRLDSIRLHVRVLRCYMSSRGELFNLLTMWTACVSPFAVTCPPAACCHITMRDVLLLVRPRRAVTCLSCNWDSLQDLPLAIVLKNGVTANVVANDVSSVSVLM